MEHLEPFISEMRDEKLPLPWRLGAVNYLMARETFLTAEERAIVEQAHADIRRAIEALKLIDGGRKPEEEPEPPRTQGTLF